MGVENAHESRRQKNPGRSRGNDTLVNVSERLAASSSNDDRAALFNTASHFDSVSRGCARTDDGASVQAQVKPDALKPLRRLSRLET